MNQMPASNVPMVGITAIVCTTLCNCVHSNKPINRCRRKNTSCGNITRTALRSKLLCRA
jgi:hypothetical protein